MPRRRALPNPCAAPDCPHQVPAGGVMCRPHWAALPASLRFAIVRTTGRADYLVNLRQAERLLAESREPAGERADDHTGEA